MHESGSPAASLAPAQPVPPPAAPLEPKLINGDLPCSRCAYNLRGLTSDMRCPECGTPIAQSLYGNWLRFADPEWLKKLQLGAALKLWGLLVSVVLTFLVGFFIGLLGAMGIAFPALMIGAELIGGLLSLVATFCITAPEPTVGKSEDPVNLRKAIRVCAVAGLLGGLLSESRTPGAVNVVLAVLGGTLSLIGLVTIFGEFVYLRRFARRIPDPKLAERTTLVMWGFGISTAVTAVFALAVATLIGFGIGPFAPGGPFAPVVTNTAAATSVSGTNAPTTTGADARVTNPPTNSPSADAANPTTTAPNANGANPTTTGPNPGAASQTTASPNAGGANPFTAAGGPPNLIGTALGGLLMCALGAAFLVFFVLYVSLLFRYYGAFRQAAAEALHLARGELPAFQLPASPPHPGAPT